MKTKLILLFTGLLSLLSLGKVSATDTVYVYVPADAYVENVGCPQTMNQIKKMDRAYRKIKKREAKALKAAEIAAMSNEQRFDEREKAYKECLNLFIVSGIIFIFFLFSIIFWWGDWKKLSIIGGVILLFSSTFFFVGYILYSNAVLLYPVIC